jgi:ABC-type sugar transport system ATPase subunit
VLILDAPTVGVDVTARTAIYGLIRQLAAAGSGLILISDEFEEVLANSTVLFVMKAGRLSPPLNPRLVSETELAEIVHG